MEELLQSMALEATVGKIQLHRVQILTPFRICLCMLLDQSQSEPAHQDDPNTSEQVAHFMLKKINVRVNSSGLPFASKPGVLSVVSFARLERTFDSANADSALVSDQHIRPLLRRRGQRMSGSQRCSAFAKTSKRVWAQWAQRWLPS
jgi:hypothetical protein